MANTKNRIIRVEDPLWHAFGHVCAEEGTNRSADLKDHMRRRVKAFLRRGGVIPPMPDSTGTSDGQTGHDAPPE